ncbi:hypothetical protein AMS68_002159 [Peltaster fructicola]|uniref:Uncharacterized protein n=1 Tax=Peltaster fructicola TaxID=286661 RepID=A0A6H0XPF1_9PEZI|nr:hypothetical protein AMS68_002159 [Peltaster fructicola]
MRFNIAVVFTSGASLCSALVIGRSSMTGDLTTVEHLAKFDDANAGLVNGVPARGLTPLGPYENLYYDNLGVISDNVVAAGLKPQSAPNVLGYDVVANAQGTPQIRSDYDDSKTNHFDLKSFYFGCVASTQETTSSKPLDCSVTYTGYRNNVQIAQDTAHFTAALTTVTANMLKVQARGFTGLDRIVFKTNGLVASTALAVLFDNLDYVVYLKE